MNRKIHNHPKLEVELFDDNIIAFEEVVVDAEFAHLFPEARKIDTPLHEGDVVAINRDDFWDERWHGRRQKQLEENKSRFLNKLK